MRAGVNGVKSQMRRFEFNHCVNIPLRILSECGKIRTRKTSNTDTFHAVNVCYLLGEKVLKQTDNLSRTLRDPTKSASQGNQLGM